MRYILFFLVCLIASCGQPGSRKSVPDTAIAGSVHYATGFRVYYFDNYTSVEVINPWDTATLLQRYVLIDRNRPVPIDLPKGTIVKVPLRNVAVYTSVHVSIIDQLGELDKITGVCEPEYMALPAVKERICSGRIADLGMATSPDIEKIIDTGTEYIIASPFPNTDYGLAEQLGIPIIEAADYMESLPLGRAEWGRFYGLLFRKEAMADSIFRDTEERYLALKTLASTATGRPAVFSEKRYGSFWHVPGNDSYVAHFIRDAGAGYVFEDIPGSGSTPFAFETVLNKAIHADVWLMKYNLTEEMTYRNLRAEYTPYENFDAYKKRNIYTCNTGKVPYYEEFPMHPDYLLKDLIRIFHPALLPGYTLRYYEKMK
jgi:iron complex transport system substrate-binding protein